MAVSTLRNSLRFSRRSPLPLSPLFRSKHTTAALTAAATARTALTAAAAAAPPQSTFRRSFVHRSITSAPPRPHNLFHSSAPSSSPLRHSTPTHIPSAAPSSIPTFPCTKSALTRISSAQTNGLRERSFFVSDVGVVERQYGRWLSQLPNVRPFYAVKCNPDETLLKVLSNLGSGFDAASAAEIDAALHTGVDPADIIFANPIKSTADLRYAAAVGVNKMTFDNEAELVKIAAHHPNAELVLRVLPDDSGSVMRFGVKFGAPVCHHEKLLRTAHLLGLNVIGTSFHIGSGCFDPKSYAAAIELCRSTFDLAVAIGMKPFTFLDLGGGFPGNPIPNESNGAVPAFESFAAVIRQSLHEHFGPHSPYADVTIIAEPGRYMATAYSTLFTFIQGKREEPADPTNPSAPKKFLYYVNDGVYGSFNCILFDHASPKPVPIYRFMNDRISLDNKRESVRAVSAAPSSSLLGFGVVTSTTLSASESFAFGSRALHTSSGPSRAPQCLSTFFGPTCDSMDVIAKDKSMEELFVGDWLAFEHMGAYTNAAATTFNGMPKPHTIYARSKAESPAVPPIRSA